MPVFARSFGGIELLDTACTISSHPNSTPKCWGSGPEWLFRSRGFAFPALHHKHSFYAVSRTFGDRPLNESRAVAISSGFFRGLGMPRKMLPKIGCFEILIRITLAM